MPEVQPPTIEIEITPVGKPRMTRSDRWKKRAATDKYWQYKDKLCSMIHIAPGTESDVLSLTFILPMPDSWSKKKKATMDGKPHTQKPDLDNLIKAFKDSLFTDDSMVHEYGPMKKRWGRVGKIVIN
jgi:Holliday junction resolvase RusA-like endonuclease